MEVKAGYKQTEVGVIPEDWEVFQLCGHFRIYAGGDVPKHSVSNFRSEAHPLPIFANALQEHGLYGFTSERRAKANSLTITARGYLGHAEYRDEEFFPIVRLLVLEPTGALNARFTTFAVNERVKFAFESTGVPQLTAPQVGKYSVAAPPLPEQRAIAEALSDVDGLLGGLERLIAKKRDIKQAAMQQLLTGKTRLPNFHGEWEVKTLRECARFCSGTYLAQDAYRDGVFEVQGAGSPMGRHIAANFAEPVTVIGRVGTVGRPRFMPVGCWVNNNAGAIIALPVRATPSFVHMLLMTMDWCKATSVTAQPFLVIESLMTMEFQLPPLPEQIAIAEVLSDMDAELAALEQRREKTRAIKQAMMQELLTGKTRLI